MECVCFAVSDAMIGISEFIRRDQALAVPIWWAYAAAMVLIVAGLIFGRPSVVLLHRRRDHRTAAKPSTKPIARVLPMLTVPHLDREFDYLVSAEQSDDAQPGSGCGSFHNRLVDAFVLERRNDTDHEGRLGWLDRVISPEPVLTAEVRRLVDAVAARYAGTRADVLRLAVPPPARQGGTRKHHRRNTFHSANAGPVGLGGLRSGWAAAGRPAQQPRRPGGLAERCPVTGGPIGSPRRRPHQRRTRCARGGARPA